MLTFLKECCRGLKCFVAQFLLIEEMYYLLISFESVSCFKKCKKKAVSFIVTENADCLVIPSLFDPFIKDYLHLNIPPPYKYRNHSSSNCHCGWVFATQASHF